MIGSFFVFIWEFMSFFTLIFSWHFLCFGSYSVRYPYLSADGKRSNVEIDTSRPTIESAQRVSQ